MWFGIGKEIGSFTFHYQKEGKTISVFSIYTDGSLRLNYGWSSKILPVEVLETFHKQIQEIPFMKQIPNNFSGWPSVKVEVLKDPENLEKFKQAVLWLQTQLKPQG